MKLEEPDWQKETDFVTASDLDVLNTVLNDTLQTKTRKPCEYLVLLNRTERYCSYAIRPWERFCIADQRMEKDEIFSGARDLNAELKKALIMRNMRLGIINGIAPERPVHLVGPKDIDTSVPNFWNDFYTRFPNSCGFASFSLPGYSTSLPGYSTNKLSAAVYFSGACGGLCGSTSIIELAFSDGRWSVKKKYVLTVS